MLLCGIGSNNITCPPRCYKIMCQAGKSRAKLKSALPSYILYRIAIGSGWVIPLRSTSYLYPCAGWRVH